MVNVVMDDNTVIKAIPLFANGSLCVIETLTTFEGFDLIFTHSVLHILTGRSIAYCRDGDISKAIKFCNKFGYELPNKTKTMLRSFFKSSDGIALHDKIYEYVKAIGLTNACEAQDEVHGYVSKGLIKVGNG